MAVIHISEAEAARDLPSLLAKVRAGEEIRIEKDAATVAVLRSPDASPRKKTLSEAIRRAKERQVNVTLDDQFSRDLETVISNHEHEGIRNLWEE